MGNIRSFSRNFYYVYGSMGHCYRCHFCWISNGLFWQKKTLIGIGILYFISAIGSGLAIDPFSFSFFRFLGGLGVGASTVTAPTYISEISPASNRGKLVALYQFNLVFGILIAFISNFLLKETGAGNPGDGWLALKLSLLQSIYLQFLEFLKVLGG